MPDTNTAPTFVVGEGEVVAAVSQRADDTGFLGRDVGQDAVIQPDGKIVLAGYASKDSQSDFGLTRLNADGTLDTTFGEGGRVVTPVGSEVDRGYSTALQSDGKILLAGISKYVVGRTERVDTALLRYNSDGSLDTGFGQGGKLIVGDSSSYQFGQSVALQPDGKILVRAVSEEGSQNRVLLTRFNGDGSLDTSFGTGGEVVAALEPAGFTNGRNLIVSADGGILVGGYWGEIGAGGIPESGFTLRRYNGDGSLDTTFGTNGRIFTGKIDTGVGTCFALQSDGKILAAGTRFGAGGNVVFDLRRYDADGSPDTSFGIDGRVLTSVGSQQGAVARSLAIQPDGKILLGGRAVNDTYYSDFALVRYNADGSLDTAFGQGGKIVTSIASGNDDAYSVVLQADGKILVTGSSETREPGYPVGNDFAAVRYNPDGSLDKTFGVRDTLSGGVSFKEGTAVVVLDGDASVYDAELFARGDYGGATLTIARSGGASTQDVFGSAGVTLGTLVEGGALVVGGVTVGTVETNSGGTLELAFNSNATQALLDAVLRQITYENLSDTPPASVGLDWTFSDGNSGSQGTGGAKTGTGTKTVTIQAVNDVPVITANGGMDAVTVFVPENTTAVSTIQTSDPEGAKLTWALAGGADQHRFKVDAKTGALYFVSAPDYEAPADTNKSNIYEVIVQVSDGELADRQRLVVKITDVQGLIQNGSDKSNAINGTVEADTLDGRGGNDKLYGLGSNDTVKGGAGDDLISGGKGADKLYGGDGKVGSGNDRFVYTASTDSTLDAAGRDTIYDFASGDRIDLSALDANWNRPDNQAFTFIGTKEYSSVGQLRYELRDGNTYIYADVTGDRRSDFSIQLDDTVRLVKEDFLL